ncbi:hypothetical protein [Vibrio sp. T11.5]|uniref:hypothetical protein n=1 Tax=Vibrio sp. T11.5 TaxID=2998836 RepID=UPI0022CDB399|nr:hypothetical protein [Vibrio sp. T11.5]MDA0117889.1 hypothetical protein [Vibrio sp. T11.5]
MYAQVEKLKANKNGTVSNSIARAYWEAKNISRAPSFRRNQSLSSNNNTKSPPLNMITQRMMVDRVGIGAQVVLANGILLSPDFKGRHIAVNEWDAETKAIERGDGQWSYTTEDIVLDAIISSPNIYRANGYYEIDTPNDVPYWQFKIDDDVVFNNNHQRRGRLRIGFNVDINNSPFIEVVHMAPV